MSEALNEACLEKLDLPLDTLLSIVPVLREILRLLEEPLYVKRFAGMLSSTSKEVPSDCKYVRLCVVEFLQHSEDFSKLINKLDVLRDLVFKDE